MGFFSRLEARARRIDSLLCIGLDPHTGELHASTPQAAESFCLRLIAATADFATAFKPNAAFFEVFGAPGWQALANVIRAVPEGIPVILDAKRGDIASTAQAYARSAFETLAADAITLNPYLGYDSLEPFLEDPEHGVFLLCKTSNPGAADFQDLPLADGMALYQEVAAKARQWNTDDNLGLVVGATQPEALRQARRLAPELWILAPGIGAQGGDLAAALLAGLRPDGLGLLLPVSRLISQAEDPQRKTRELCEASPPAARRLPGRQSGRTRSACLPLGIGGGSAPGRLCAVRPVHPTLRAGLTGIPGSAPSGGLPGLAPDGSCRLPALAPGARVRPPGSLTVRRPAHRYRHQFIGRLVARLPAERS